jgi:pilus assembly protein FimV
MVGLFRANPRAFDGGNMNRLKAGVSLKVPDADAIMMPSPAAARREIAAQTEDWRAYRKSIADSVAGDTAAPAPQAAGQTSGGKLAGPQTPAPQPAQAQKDVLTLGKNATLPGQQADTEAQLREQEADATAREKALAESAERIALLEKQIQDMQAMVERQGGNAAARDGAGAGPLAAPAPVAAPGWYEPLLSNPLYWGGGLALIALGGLLWWTMAGGARRSKPALPFEDSLMKNDAPGVSIATHPGGTSVNTGHSSFLTDFSQTGLAAIDTQDVDPVAEADVYMAYGRDSQAEEILKEAVGKYPERHEIRMKLLEIYAARRNTAAFESVAGALLAALGNPPGAMWDSACELGRVIDPGNPLYGEAVAPIAETTAPAASMPVTEPASPVAVPRDTMTSNVLEFDSAEPASKGASASETLPDPASSLASDNAADKLDLPEFDLSLDTSADVPVLDSGFAEANGPDSKFDFSGLDLDLGPDAGDAAADEVSTKLDLARAYVEMGDKEGAREILGEVMKEGSEAQKTSAQALLDSLA